MCQLCPTLCNPICYTVHGLLQARILEWWPFPSLGDLPNPEIKPGLPHCRLLLFQLSHKYKKRMTLLKGDIGRYKRVGSESGEKTHK